MNRALVAWTVVCVLAGGFLVFRAATRGVGLAYVRAVPVAAPPVVRVKYVDVDPRFHRDPDVRLSLARTAGLWIAALLTLSVFSFLYGDNPAYKFAEAVFVGSSAAYAMVIAFWTGVVEKLLANLIPGLMRAWFLPGLPASQEADLLYLVPLAMGGMLLWRLAPVGGWISRWPLAFFIGATAGFRLVAYLDADFVKQIQNTILPLIVLAPGGGFDLAAMLRNQVLLLGVLSCLVYFFFSVEHTGWSGRVARLGIAFLMITFGASFGYTVMGRVALLAERIEFLCDDWLWLIDPTGKRDGM